MPTVTIVGGGIIGMSIAWRLAQQGTAVTVMEAGRLGGEASWAGAGMLAPGSEITTAGGWRGLALESARLYPEFVAELKAVSGVAIDYRACGAVELARTSEEWREMEQRAILQAALGIVSKPLTREQAVQLVPHAKLDAWVGAMHYPNDAIVDPRDVTAALRVALEGLGVVVREGHRVGSVDGIRADAVVIAAGAWSSEIHGIDLPKAFPVRGHLTGYQLAAGTLNPILRQGHTYLLQRSSGFLIAGTSEERVGFDGTIDPATEAAIRGRAEGVLPMLAGVPSETWIGFRPATESLEPEIRQAPGKPVWLAYGHYRNGILMAPATARRVVDEISASWEKTRA